MDDVKKVVVKKKQAISESYTLQSLVNVVSKLLEVELITKEEAEVIRKIKEKAVGKYMKKKFGE